MALIAVNGAAGRMGRRVIALALEDGVHKVVAGIVRPGDARVGEDAGAVAGAHAIGVPLTTGIPAGVQIEAAIDFSDPDASALFVAECCERKIPVVVATTGL